MTNSTSSITSHPVWNSGDVELISCDNVSFKISQYRLQAWSRVLRKKVRAGELSLHLEERAVTIESFFHLIHDGKPTVKRIVGAGIAEQCAWLFNFCSKYECDDAIFLLQDMAGHLKNPDVLEANDEVEESA